MACEGAPRARRYFDLHVHSRSHRIAIFNAAAYFDLRRRQCGISIIYVKIRCPCDLWISMFMITMNIDALADH